MFMSYRHPYWYDYGKTDADLDAETTVVKVMLIAFLVIVLAPVVLMVVL